MVKQIIVYTNDVGINGSLMLTNVQIYLQVSLQNNKKVSK